MIIAAGLLQRVGEDGEAGRVERPRRRLALGVGDPSELSDGAVEPQPRRVPAG
jgi:hypothetical protein